MNAHRMNGRRSTASDREHFAAYTVVGCWHDSGQTIVEHVTAGSPEAAVNAAIEQLADSSSADELEGIEIAQECTVMLAVFPGHHFPCLVKDH